MADSNNTSSDGLSLTTLTALVIANMIGVGVFTSSGFSLATLGSPGKVMLAWWICGVWAICGAVAYGALAARLPLSGGEYLFLSRLVHPAVGFMAGWISVVAGFTAPIAAAALGAAVYLKPLLPEWAPDIPALAAALIVIATVSHLAGISIGTGAQNLIVAAKLAMLAIFLVWAFLISSRENWAGAALPGEDPSWVPSGTDGWITLVGSMSWIALSYTGFNAAIYVAGESHNARRTVPRAMFWGTLLVTVIYLLLNGFFVYAPAPDKIAGQEGVAAIAAKEAGGTAFELLVRVTIVFAMCSSVFAMLLAGPRVYQRMAEDFLPQFRTPSTKPQSWIIPTAILIQATLSIVALLVADLLQIMKYLGLTLSACGALAILSLIWIRRRMPDSQPLAWWEKTATAIYLLITLAILAASRTTHADEFKAMLITFAVGLAVYLIWVGVEPKAKRTPQDAPDSES